MNSICYVGYILGRVMRGFESLTVEPVENDETGEQGFEAQLDDDRIIGYGVTAIGALVDLAQQIQVVDAEADSI